jgi:CubicO group peptidase (beta-lactamase class C family)
MKRVRNDDNKIVELLKQGVSEGVYPGAVLLVAKNSQIVFSYEVGYLSLSSKPVPMRKDIIFDLASLTKPLTTALCLMKLVDQDVISLDQPISELITTSPLKEKKDITSRLLLNHSAGFVDWKPFYQDLIKYGMEERKRVLREWLVETPLTYQPEKDCIYSDLGFMFLEWLIEEISGVPMQHYVEHNFYHPLSFERTFLSQRSSSKLFETMVFAPTEDCPWRKRVMQGEVHDENAFALGGHSGHAGLFGVVDEVYGIVNLLKEHYQGHRDDYLKPATVREFFRRQNRVNGCTWALGWDTPSPQDSSSGSYFSPNSVGHLGFTGTSIWMDLDRDVLVIFLTNRVHPTRNNEKIKEFRPKLHNLVMEELGIV